MKKIYYLHYMKRALLLLMGVAIACTACNKEGKQGNYNCRQYIYQLPDIDHMLFVPSMFTPNGDDYNPVFTPFVRNADVVNLVVFDSQGNTSTDNPWTGKFNNVPAPDGKYFFLVYVHFTNGRDTTLTGHVYLARNCMPEDLFMNSSCMGESQFDGEGFTGTVPKDPLQSCD
jgi:gliding motility-associated-like protein